MKKYILVLLVMLGVVPAWAEMEIKTGSFRDVASGNKAIGGDNGMGVTNMVAENVVWPLDEDGNEGTLAYLQVFFENLSPDDIKRITPTVDNGSSVHSKTFDIIDGRYVLSMYLRAGKSISVTFNHPILGSVRVPVKDYEPRHIYEVGVLNKGTENITVTSEPAGARVRFDGEEMQGVTPLTIPHVAMGDHTISLLPSDSRIANPVPTTMISVGPDNLAFSYDMYKRKTVTIVAEPSNSDLSVTYNGRIVAQGRGKVTIYDAPYERAYKIVGRSGSDEVEDNLFISDDVPSLYPLKVVGSCSLTVTAKQNNSEVIGATVFINGKEEGRTPLTKLLIYGKYDVGVEYGGYAKMESVNLKSKDKDLLLRIPNRKRVGYNPFDSDYKPREWGIAVNYVYRTFNFKANGKSTKYNWVGNPGGSNAIQAGIVYQPYFGAGQGLSTGLFWQHTFGDVEGGTEMTYEEEAVYLPLQYQFRLPLHSNFSIAVNAGAALTYGVSNQWKENEEKFDVGYGHSDEFDTYHPDALDYSLLFGAALQWKALQLEGKYSLGLKDHKVMYTADEGETASYKSSFFSIGISLIF